MPSDRTAPKKSSTNPKTAGKMPRRAPGSEPEPARAHRDDTTEARQQRAGMPKTHAPHRSPIGGVRKDKRS
jgi:hypothetical protein